MTTWPHLTLKLQLNAPLIQNYAQGTPHTYKYVIAVTAAIILKQGNMHMSAFIKVVSQILDNGGATDEVKMKY